MFDLAELADQVEEKVARVKRVSRQSSKIVAEAHEDLASHEEWLDRHRTTWAREVNRHRRRFDRKLAIREAARLAVGRILAAPFVLAWLLEPRPKTNRPRPSPQPRQTPAERAAELTRHARLQLRIRGLDERSGTMRKVAPQPGVAQTETRRGCPPPQETAASRVPAAPARSPKREVPVPALAAIALLLIAAGVLRATLSALSVDGQELGALKATDPEPQAAAASMTVSKAAPKAEKPATPSGFALLAASPSRDAPQLPAQTVAAMISITRPLSLAPMEAETAPMAFAEEPLVTKPAAKAKRKRRMAARDPQPLPWWQQWSWIKVR